ncbi:MAG: TonB-dependent receptor [Marinilabiliales bacterium]|nr:MAG: TonB-dependent receptor [Marinilabiliales bacterium]
MLRQKYLLVISIMLLMAGTIYAQKYTISGYVQDLRSGERIISASVYDLKTKQGTITNEYGFFSLTLPSDTVELSISFVGYAAFSSTFYLDSDISMNIELDPTIQLAEVTITDKKSDDLVKSTQMSMIDMPIHQIKALPVMFGEADVLKTLQLMPGVQSGSEGTSGIYVRGGGPDQNLILLDGVPVYNASHLFGFFSVFNTDAISSVKLIKGGFPARYGGRLSSVIDIRMKEGNMKEFHGEGSIGNVAAKFTFEGPIIKDKTSFIVSGRRTYIDVLAAPIVAAVSNSYGDGEKLRAGYYFYDTNVKLNHKFSEKDRVYASFYTGLDKAYVRTSENYVWDDTTNYDKSIFDLHWGNIKSALRWNHIFTNKLFANVTGVYSNYSFITAEQFVYERGENIVSDISFNYNSGIENIGGTIDFDYRPIPAHSIKFGGNYLYHTFEPGVFTFSVNEEGQTMTQNIGNNDIYANEFYAYAEDNWNINGIFKVNLGIHYSGFAVQDRYYDSFQPRVSMRAIINERMSIKAAYSEMNQYIHLLTNSTIGLPTDLWLPSTDSVLPEYSRQAALGIAYNIDDNWDVSLEGYYKTMDNLIEYKEGASFFQLSTGWESKIEMGRGYSYGAELLVRKNYGKLSGWIGYTLSWSWRQFDNIDFGEPFPYKYDRRHDISIVALYKLNENVDFGLTWVYGTGNAVTLAVARYASGFPYEYYDYYDDYYSSFADEVEFYNGRNSYRMPAYHRIDLSANLHKEKKWGTRTWSFGLYNAYSRQNPFYLYFGYQNNTRVLKQVSLFPIIPSVRY